MGWFFARRGHDRWAEQLHGYADGELGVRDELAVRGHLQDCERCRTELAGIRELKASLQALPEAEAPRSFRLTPEMVAPPVPMRTAQTPRWLPRVAQVAGGVAMAGFAALLAVDLFAVNGNGGRDNTTTLMAAGAQEDASADVAANSQMGGSGNAAPPDAEGTPATELPSYTPGTAHGAGAGDAENQGTPTDTGRDSNYEAQAANTPAGEDGSPFAQADDLNERTTELAPDAGMQTIQAPPEDSGSGTDKRLLRSMEAVLASVGLSALALGFLAKRSARS